MRVDESTPEKKCIYSYFVYTSNLRLMTMSRKGARPLEREHRGDTDRGSSTSRNARQCRGAARVIRAFGFSCPHCFHLRLHHFSLGRKLRRRISPSCHAGNLKPLNLRAGIERQPLISLSSRPR